MKNLKTLLIVGIASFSLNAQGMKLQIVKKSAIVAHKTIDKAEVDSISAESGLKNKISAIQIDEDGFDTIKVKTKSNRKAASRGTYKRTKIKAVKRIRKAPKKLKRRAKLPKSDSVTLEEAVKQIETSIGDEFEDEIG